MGQTKLTDADANGGQGFTADEFLGEFLKPDTGQALETLIVSNTATELLVWGDFEAAGTSGAAYQVKDYRLDSSAGSPCIDAADNNVAESCGLDLDGNERFVDDPDVFPNPGEGSPEHPDDIVDMGAYEFAGLPLTDCNGNAMDDDCEVSEGTTPDCNTNGIPDECDIADGTSLDCNANGVPDSCCPADIDGDEIVNPFDLAQLLGDWGPCPDPCSPGTPTCGCQADIDNDCTVDALDLAFLLGAWGPCE